MLSWYGSVIILWEENECGDRIEKIDAGNYVQGYEKLCQRVPSDTMTGERPASKNSTNVGTGDVTGESNRYEHLSQTGEEFSPEFIRDRVGIKRVNVMPNVDHFQPRGLTPDFGNDKPTSSYYEDVRSPFNNEKSNTDCGMRGSVFYDSPIVQNPIRIPFSHVRRTSCGGGHGNEETASPWEAVPDQLATLLTLTELSPSNKLKFLCSYGGRILPRPSDSRLRYVGGETRIISIRRNISWDELVRKTSVICNQPHTIKYQLPGEDLDALISVCSDEDLLNMIEEYGELEKNGNSQRLRIFLVSLSESESPSSFEVRSEQQQDVDYQYVVAVNGMFDPSPQKSAKVGNQVFHLGGSSFDHSPGGQSRRDSPTYFQAMEARDYSPSSHLRLTPHILTAPLEVRNDVPKTLHDNSYYYGGNDGDPSSANKLHVLYNCSTEDGPISSNRSLQLLMPSSTDEEPSIRTMFDESRVIPLENVVRYSDDRASWLVKSMEKDVPMYRIVHTLSDAQLQGYGDGYDTFAEQGAGGIACAVNISAENVPLLAYSSPSQEWYMKSQDIKKEHSCDPEEVVLTNEARTSNGDQGGVISSLIDTDITVPSRDNREVSADSVAESNSRSYQVGLTVTESVIDSAIDRVSSYRISATSSAVKESFWETNTAKVLGQRDNENESNPTNTNESVCDERRDRGSVRPLIVEDVTEKEMEDIPTRMKVIPHVQHDPELSESNVSSPKEFEGSVTPDTDYEDVKSDDQDDSEDPISDAAMAEIEAGIYGLQIIKNADLEELRELGSGTFGTVYHGKWRGTDVAIKRIKKSCFAGRLSEQERIMKDFWREAKILSNLHHPNVVAFYGVVPDGPGGTLATVTEFMVNGSLRHNLMRNSRLLDRRRKVMIAMDAAFGMEYLHLKNIVHFDLKCDNLLVNLKDPRRPICKVGDFGLSRIKQNTLVSGGIRGTLPWMAPELLNGTNSRVSEKVDIYSFGIAMWEMLTGEEPYANMHCGAIIGGIVNNNLRPPIPDRCDNKWRKLMEECWSAEPSCRPTFTEVTLRLQDMLKTLQPKQRYSSSENKPK